MSNLTLLNEPVCITPGMWLLPGFADSAQLKTEIDQITASAPLRHMQTRRGFSMSVGMTNCGSVGWVSDRKGYRYSETDPESGLAWPPMPAAFSELAHTSAEQAGFSDFSPDACLINLYEPGAQMGAHQDRNERSFDHPIVSVSLGISARFFVLGNQKTGRAKTVELDDGDVLIFGGEARHYFHGVRKLKPAHHALFGACRWNLTFRVAR